MSAASIDPDDLVLTPDQINRLYEPVDAAKAMGANLVAVRADDVRALLNAYARLHRHVRAIRRATDEPRAS